MCKLQNLADRIKKNADKNKIFTKIRIISRKSGFFLFFVLEVLDSAELVPKSLLHIARISYRANNKTRLLREKQPRIGLENKLVCTTEVL